jgi:quercetin dioxygenase-like cupin family protein
MWFLRDKSEIAHSERCVAQVADSGILKRHCECIAKLPELALQTSVRTQLPQRRNEKMSSQKLPVPSVEETFVTNLCYTPASPALWRNGFWPFFQYRDLGLHGASRGAMGAEHVRFVGSNQTTGWFRHNLEFDWIYVLKGQVSVEYETGKTEVLNADDAILLPAGFGLRFSAFSSDYEALEITTPAQAALVLERTAPTPKGAGKPIVNRDTTESHVAGDGLRRFFKYRELGIAAATKGRIHIHVISIAEKSPGGTGWHYHAAGQFAYVLGGWGTVSLKDQQALQFKTGDAISVCPGYRHDVPDYSMAYKVIELIAPAEYDTIAEAAPTS